MLVSAGYIYFGSITAAMIVQTAVDIVSLFGGRRDIRPDVRDVSFLFR